MRGDYRRLRTESYENPLDKNPDSVRSQGARDAFHKDYTQPERQRDMELLYQRKQSEKPQTRG